MLESILYCMQIFFTVLDVVVLLYLLRSFLMVLPFGAYIVEFVITLMLPIWVPMQYMLRHSILHTLKFDLSPYILLLVLTYLQTICSILIS